MAPDAGVDASSLDPDAAAPGAGDASGPSDEDASAPDDDAGGSDVDAGASINGDAGRRDEDAGCDPIYYRDLDGDGFGDEPTCVIGAVTTTV